MKSTTNFALLFLLSPSLALGLYSEPALNLVQDASGVLFQVK